MKGEVHNGWVCLCYNCSYLGEVLVQQYDIWWGPHVLYNYRCNYYPVFIARK